MKDLKSEIAALERDLSGSGSLKTVDDVQEELNKVTDEMWVALACCNFPDPFM